MDINKKVTSNKRKHVEVGKELNELSEKVKLISTSEYNFLLGLLGRVCFAGDDGYQNFCPDAYFANIG